MLIRFYKPISASTAIKRAVENADTAPAPPENAKMNREVAVQLIDVLRNNGITVNGAYPILNITRQALTNLPLCGFSETTPKPKAKAAKVNP